MEHFYLDRDVESLPDIDDSAADTPVISPETRLWNAVILNEWQDAFIRENASISGTDRKTEPSHIRQEARRWLTSNIDPWANDRRTVCDFADISEPMLRRAAKKRLELCRESDNEREAKSQKRNRELLDSMLERLLQKSDSVLHSGRVNQRLDRLAELELENY